jgi:hypothetical protein
MTEYIKGLRKSAEKSFKIASQVLIPNERPYIACQTSKGFLVVSSRRIASLHEGTKSGYQVTKSVPFEAVTSPESLVRTFGIKEPRRTSGESREAVKNYLELTLSQCIDIVEELRDPEKKGVELTSRTFSYLGNFPQCLTQDALLDLNTVLEDQPVDHRLVTRALNFLGTDTVLIEETLRDADDKENGILFAAGQRGFFWVRGQKHDCFLTNVVVDTVEWNNIQFFGQRWADGLPLIIVTYSHTSKGKSITTEYQWNPPLNDETLRAPWFVQPANGPFIFEDIVYKYTGRTMSPVTDIQSG